MFDFVYYEESRRFTRADWDRLMHLRYDRLVRLLSSAEFGEKAEDYFLKRNLDGETVIEWRTRDGNVLRMGPSGYWEGEAYSQIFCGMDVELLQISVCEEMAEDEEA